MSASEGIATQGQERFAELRWEAQVIKSMEAGVIGPWVNAEQRAKLRGRAVQESKGDRWEVMHGEGQERCELRSVQRGGC